jgi:NADPH2:quinone reductase
MMLQGLTAHYLTTDTYPYKKGDYVLIHAGAGGTGSLCIQIAKAKGLNVITTVGSDEKVKVASNCGADHVIVYTKDDVYTKVMEITSNKGVSFVLDGIGLSTYQTSMKCCKKRGFVILFGNASGSVPPIDPQVLTANGSLFITRPTLADYILTQDEFLTRCNDIFDMVSNKKLEFIIGQEFDLNQIQDAHNAIESRQTIGKVVINVRKE